MSTSRPYPRRRLSSSYGYRRRALRVVRTHQRPFVTPTVEDDSDDDSSSASSCYTSSSDSFFGSSSDSSSDDDAEPVAQVVPPQLAAARTTMDSSRRASAIRLTLTDSSDDDDDSSSHHSSSSSDTFMSDSSSSDDSDDAPLSSRRSSSLIRAMEHSSRYNEQDEWSRLVAEMEQHMEALRRLAVEMQRVIMSTSHEDDDRLTRLRMTRMQHDSRRLSIVMEMQAETQRRLAESSERRQHAMSLAVPFGSADDRMSRRGGVVHIPEHMRYPPDDVPARRRQEMASGGEVHIPEHMSYPVPRQRMRVTLEEDDDVPARRQVASGGEVRNNMSDSLPHPTLTHPHGGVSSSQSSSSSSRVVPFGTADDSTTRPARVTWEDQVHPTRDNVSANDQVGLFASANPWEELVSAPFGNTETTISEAHFLDAMQQSVRRHRNRQERTLRTAQAVSQAVANLLLYGSSDDEDDVFSSSDDEVTQRVTTLQVAWSELGVDLAVAQSVTCSICLENAPSNLSKINCCNHLFCHECIHTWSERQNTCPLCKRRFAVITHAMRQQQETVTS